MAISFYDASITTYLQGVAAMVELLEKAATHFPAEALEMLPGTSLHPDMRPLRFQIGSVRHHSLGAIEGFRSGIFKPPGGGPEDGFAGLQALAARTRDALTALDRDEVAALIEAGSFSLPVAHVLPLSEIAEAQRLSEDGHAGGKIVLTVE